MKIDKYLDPQLYIAYIKKRLIRSKFKSVGKNFAYDPLSVIMTPNLITVGDNVFWGEGAHISAELTIGNNVMFGPRVCIFGGNHYFGVIGKSVRFLHPKNRENSKPIFIEDEVWVGSNTTILPGVRLHIGSVVAAGSIVSKDVPPFVVAGGNTCKPLKLIFSDDDLVKHLVLLNYTKSFTKNVVDRRQRMLCDLGVNDLEIINQTGIYWETKDLYND